MALHSLCCIAFATNEVEVVEDAIKLHFVRLLYYYYLGRRDGSACQMALNILFVLKLIVNLWTSCLSC